MAGIWKLLEAALDPYPLQKGGAAVWLVRLNEEPKRMTGFCGGPIGKVIGVHLSSLIH